MHGTEGLGRLDCPAELEDGRPDFDARRECRVPHRRKIVPNIGMLFVLGPRLNFW